MSTTESPTLPEWEADTRDRQPPPMLNAERVADLAYLHARIQEMLTRSTECATDPGHRQR
ncbi:hypothetical protein ACQP0C_39835 [Nocardia sp. CA-129566]|uniref:hypothetical protein n=1 Tax=Nocardia sp. CA-129566 TaxID=3239976 RepID=UPI003D9929A2